MKVSWQSHRSYTYVIRKRTCVCPIILLLLLELYIESYLIFFTGRKHVYTVYISLAYIVIALVDFVEAIISSIVTVWCSCIHLYVQWHNLELLGFNDVMRRCLDEHENLKRSKSVMNLWFEIKNVQEWTGGNCSTIFSARYYHVRTIGLGIICRVIVMVFFFYYSFNRITQRVFNRKTRTCTTNIWIPLRVTFQYNY